MTVHYSKQNIVADLSIIDGSPALDLKDSDCTDSDINAQVACNATDTGSGSEDVDVTLKQQVAGTLTTFLQSDADGTLTVGQSAQNILLNGPVITELDIDGRVELPRTAITGDAPTTATHLYLGWDGGAADTITVQTTDIGMAGRLIIVKDEGGSASANPLTIATEGAETIDGAASYTIADDYGWAWLLSDGSNLFVIAHS